MAAPRGSPPRAPIVTPVAAIPAIPGRKPSQSPTLTFGAATAAGATPAMGETASARFPRGARTVQGIQGESATKPSPARSPEAPSVPVARVALSTPASEPTREAPRDEAPRDDGLPAALFGDEPSEAPREDGLPAALFGDDDADLPAVLRDGLPDVPPREPARVVSEPPDPDAAVDDVIATLGRLDAAPGVIGARAKERPELRDAPVDLPDPTGASVREPAPKLEPPKISASDFAPFSDGPGTTETSADRKSTRLNSSHRLTSRMPSSA
jgi:hypothetical protein